MTKLVETTRSHAHRPGLVNERPIAPFPSWQPDQHYSTHDGSNQTTTPRSLPPTLTPVPGQVGEEDEEADRLQIVETVPAIRHIGVVNVAKVGVDHHVGRDR